MSSEQALVVQSDVVETREPAASRAQESATATTNSAKYKPSGHNDTIVVAIAGEVLQNPYLGEIVHSVALGFNTPDGLAHLQEIIDRIMSEQDRNQEHSDLSKFTGHIPNSLRQMVERCVQVVAEALTKTPDEAPAPQEGTASLMDAKDKLSPHNLVTSEPVTFPEPVNAIGSSSRQDTIKPPVRLTVVESIDNTPESSSTEILAAKSAIVQSMSTQPASGPGPKKRGRPRKNPPPDITLANGSPPNTSTPPRKRGRPFKVSNDDDSPQTNTKAPSSSNKRLMAAVRRDTKLKERDAMPKRPVPPLPTVFSGSQSPALPVQHLNNGAGRPMQLLTTYSAPTSHLLINRSSHNGLSASSVGSGYHSMNISGYSAVGDMSAQVQPQEAVPNLTSCDCNAVKAVMRDIFFRNAVQDNDVWVVPNVTALQLHHYFGGGTPAPEGDLTLTSDKVAMLRNLLF